LEDITTNPDFTDSEFDEEEEVEDNMESDGK
jgi:hypothetical protein